MERCMSVLTSDLVQRVYQHRENLTPGFTRHHGVHLLVWYEMGDTMDAASAREAAREVAASVED